MGNYSHWAKPSGKEGVYAGPVGSEIKIADANGTLYNAGTSLTQPSNTIYVDNGRTDTYTEDGTELYPYKSLQDAHDSITDSSATNTYEISVKLGLPYTGNLTLSADYLTISGNGASKGAGYTGTVTSTSQHLCIQYVHIKDGSVINQSRVGHFCSNSKRRVCPAQR